MSGNSTTVILTHGAWADGSSWGKVILPLERHGLRVIAAPIPLTSLTDDVAALRRTIERTRGPVILAAHAYAGGVISAATHERVKSLIYVAALTPDKGETVGDVFYRGKPHPKAPQLAPDADGLIWMPEQASETRSRRMLALTRWRSWLPHSGRSPCLAFKNHRPSRLGKRSPRGFSWRRRTA
jgi:pimeloyl-ACP methyl ester carboxylesterase